MFGLSVVKTHKLLSIYDKIAILAEKIIRQEKFLYMEIKGKVVQSFGVQNGVSKAGKEWSKASILIETDGKYPKKILLENLKNAEDFSKIAVGFTGVFQVEISSNEYNGRWYTSVNCWKWEIDGQAALIPQSSTPTIDAMGLQGFQRAEPQKIMPKTDDLPF